MRESRPALCQAATAAPATRTCCARIPATAMTMAAAFVNRRIEARCTFFGLELELGPPTIKNRIVAALALALVLRRQTNDTHGIQEVTFEAAR